MKKIKYLAAAWTVAALVSFGAVQAQIIPNTYIAIDWQYNMPAGSHFADKGTGWGMNFEGGYFVTPAITVGPFISYHTNLKSIDRQTLQLAPGTAMTTNQKHSLFQLPFGVAGRYNFMEGSVLQPYVGLKLGASYAQMSSYYYIVKQHDDTWGFYAAPEIGLSIFPIPSRRFGIHMALFYGYATNNTQLLNYSISGMNSYGVRVGVSF
ncbi:MAG: outer membrane beta-barrel protein [Alistipes sp.]